MAIVTRLKPLLSSSKLFVDEAELGQQKSTSKFPGPTPKGAPTGKKQKGRPNWKRISKNYVKIGSGGTLDPLADGVLGWSVSFHIKKQRPEFVQLSVLEKPPKSWVISPRVARRSVYHCQDYH